jgi:hypothetical protein
MVLPGTIVPPVADMASIDTGVLLFSPLRLPSDPTVKPVIADINKYAPGTAITQRSIEAYDITEMFAAALKKANPKTYTAATVLAAMNHITNYSPPGGMFHAYTTSSKVPGVLGKRTFNHWCIEYEANGATTKTIGSWLPIAAT